jgi:hypothetical protein
MGPPEGFGPFRVLHQIGAGAQGPVFRAYEPDQDKLVAVKLFRLDLPPERVHQLVASLEALIAADVTHPAIAAPIATGITGVSAYLAQDFVAADSLDIVIRDHGAAPPLEALRIVTQIAGALDFAAVVEVFHGALHPRDVLVTADDTRVTGLGVAQALEGVGVPAPMRRPYSAPERGEGGAWDRRADVFSLAVLAYELLWARRVSSLGQDAADTVTELPGCDVRALRVVFARALAIVPAHRFPTALAFAEALREAVTPAIAQGAQPVIVPAVPVPPVAARARVDVEPLLPLGVSEDELPEMTLRPDVHDEAGPRALDDLDEGVPEVPRVPGVPKVPGVRSWEVPGVLRKSERAVREGVNTAATPPGRPRVNSVTSLARRPLRVR